MSYPPLPHAKEFRASRLPLFSHTYELQSCVNPYAAQPYAKHRGMGYAAINLFGISARKNPDCIRPMVIHSAQKFARGPAGRWSEP